MSFSGLPRGFCLWFEAIWQLAPEELVRMFDGRHWNGTTASSVLPRRGMSHADSACSGGVLCGINWPAKPFWKTHHHGHEFAHWVGRDRVPALAALVSRRD